MTSDLSVLGLLLQASIPVKIVMILLILASLVSWTIIFTKRRLIRRTRAASDDFEASFWSGGDLNTLYQSASRKKGGTLGMASIFESGFREFNRGLQSGEVNPDKLIEECRRAMHVSQMREVDRLEQGLFAVSFKQPGRNFGIDSALDDIADPFEGHRERFEISGSFKLCQSFHPGHGINRLVKSGNEHGLNHVR